MQEKKTSLRGDRESDFVCQFKAATAFEMLLIEEHLNVPAKLRLIRARKLPKDRDVTRDNGLPCCRKWPGAQTLATPTLESSENDVGAVSNER